MNGGAKILVADDDETARDTAAALLASEPYEIVFATSGGEALESLESVDPDVILLDVMMPDLDGFETCSRIKQDRRWRHVPVILLTALDRKEDLLHGLECGADEFLTKPVRGAELRARVRTMLRIKRQYDEMAATLRLRDDLAHMIVHDMRNPITSIIGYTALLEKSDPTPRQTRYLAALGDSVSRLQEFVDGILLLSKLEHGNLLLQRAPVDWPNVLSWLEQSCTVAAEASGIALATSLEECSGGAPLELDTNLMKRVLENLVSNAIKFSPEGSSVAVEVRCARRPDRASPTVRIRVRDEGPGISEEHRERIFDKFETLQLRHEGVSQTGLGLNFCKLVVDSHGGRIFVEPNSPGGSVFTIEI